MIFTKRTTVSFSRVLPAAILAGLLMAMPGVAAAADVTQTVTTDAVAVNEPSGADLAAGSGSGTDSDTTASSSVAPPANNNISTTNGLELADVAAAIGANHLWARGTTGAGIGIALIDTGVVPVPGLDGAGKVINGLDFSFESQIAQYRHLDTYGHGTHMAGIIAGNDPASGWTGIAPGAHLVSIKVAGRDGAVDVTQIIAALDWTTKHADELGVRIINLSYGTTGTQAVGVDPLVHAVEQARQAGLVVVIAGGNDGFGTESLNTPATHPGILAVGSADLNGTLFAHDDTVSDFSSHGTAQRPPSLVAPGRSMISLRSPGSSIDEAVPSARRGSSHFVGSGTSQAAAVTAGAVALLLQERPMLTPDQVAHMLKVTADSMPNADKRGRGAGRLNILAASTHSAPGGASMTVSTSGTGSIEASRGQYHVSDGDVVLQGEIDIFGQTWTPSWASSSTSRTSWSGGQFRGRTVSGDCFCEDSFAGPAWTTGDWSTYTTFSGSSFDSASADDPTWSGRSWSGGSWSGGSWSGRSWSGGSWSGGSWSGGSWSGGSWSGGSWSSGGWS